MVTMRLTVGTKTFLQHVGSLPAGSRQPLRYPAVSRFSAILLWLLVLVTVDAQSRVGEVQALMSFRQDVETYVDDYISYSYQAYWSTWNENDENACAWVGVTCTPNSTVAALDLSNWGIKLITSFAALSKLPDLRHLDMSWNIFLTGASTTFSIPDDVGSLNQLTWLDLSNGDFRGKIPQSISSCRSLRYLSLEGNTFSGGIPDLRELVNLQFLILAGCELTGSFPRELVETNNLVTIDVSQNYLSGRIPSLMNSTNLVNLWLFDNYFVGFEEPMYINAPNLQHFSVSDNNLEGSIPVAFTNLTNLRLLAMSRNRLSGKIPAGLSNLMVSSLSLSENQLSGSVPVDLIQPPRDGAEWIFVNISYNHLNGSIPQPTFTRKQSLYVFLYLSNNQLTGPIPNMEVYFVDVANNFLSGDVVDVLIASQGFGGATTMNLGNNHFTGDLSRLTSHWATWSVVALNLGNNNLSWRTSESIPDPLSAALGSFPKNLSILWVGGNNFSGTSLPLAPLPGVLDRLLMLDFSNSQLEGKISGDVFNGRWLPNLTSLDLSNNSATGPIPDAIIELPSLQFLDVSNNNLSGPLPHIPVSSSLLNASFFVGNDGLCGYPLPQCPQLLPNHENGVHWWILFIIVGGSMMIAVGSCLIVTCRWRVYRKRHQQDADLIRTLMERELVSLMPLRTLKKATYNFAESARIGEGGFGTVYIGKLNDGTTVAIKRSKQAGSDNCKEQFLNEVRILSQVNHRHLVKLMGCCMENKVALLVFEFVSNGTLQEHLQGKIMDGHLSWKQRLDIAVQTADALNYLHSAATFPIYHRDVKSANILLNEDLSAKVADFGISKLAPMNATHVSTALQGTMGYIDPEYWISFQLTEKSDVYSFGVVLLELISAKLPVDFQRGGEETSLVVFAGGHIACGDLEPLIDPHLMGTYGEQNGEGKESILNVGRLAMKCVNMHAKVRPSMNEVWKELQDLCLKFNGTINDVDLGCLKSIDSMSPRPDYEALLAQYPFNSGSSFFSQRLSSQTS